MEIFLKLTSSKDTGEIFLSACVSALCEHSNEGSNYFGEFCPYLLSNTFFLNNVPYWSFRDTESLRKTKNFSQF